MLRFVGNLRQEMANSINIWRYLRERACKIDNKNYYYHQEKQNRLNFITNQIGREEINRMKKKKTRKFAKILQYALEVFTIIVGAVLAILQIF